MRRLLVAAAALLITLTACESTIIGYGPDDGPSYISIVVGITGGEFLDQGYDEDISQLVIEKWAEQERKNRLEESVLLAEDIALIQPDLIDISISEISFTGDATNRPSIRDNGCDGYIATMLDALENAGVDYQIQGETTAFEQAFVITMPDSRVALAKVRVMEYYLRLVQPDVQDDDRDVVIIPSAEPRWDPPSTREKRAGSRPGG